MNKDSLVEFTWFKGIQDKLTKVLVEAGFDSPQSEELGFLLAQAIRDVPHLLHLLNEIEQHSTDEIMDAVHMVLANRFALEEAHSLLVRRTIPNRGK